MTLWATEPVDLDPQIRLSSWSVRELEDGSRHFVGYNAGGREGRVSSRIESFDASSLRGVTRSGRVYELVGPGGRDGDAEYVWASWCRLNGVDPASAHEVDPTAATAPKL